MTRPLPLLMCVSLIASVGACSGSSAEDSASGSETAGDGDGDGDGDGAPGDGDGASGDGDGTPGDGDGDGACPLDPPPAQTTMGSWAELPEPTVGFDCTMAEGDGPAWADGIVVADGGSIDFIEIGSDGKAYAAGSFGDGSMLAGVELDGQGPNSQGERWARSWTYDGEAWAPRGLVAAGSGRVWLATAPEHLLAAGEDGSLLDGPIEVYPPGPRYLRLLGSGDDQLLLAYVDRGMPPTCVDNTRLQAADHTTAELLPASPSLVTNMVFAVDGDRSGGSWMASLNLNGAALTANHYDVGGGKIGSFEVSNQANNVMAVDMAVAGDGELVFVLRSLGFVEVHRYAPDGTQLWTTMLPDFGQQYGEPRVAIDGNGAAIVGVTLGSGFELGRVLADGTVDWGGSWTCGAEPVELHDVAVAGNGDIWVGGVQGQTAWMGAY